MEESVWLFFGVLAAIITIGIIGNIVVKNVQETKLQRFDASLELLKSQCNFVCQSQDGTNLGIGVELPSGIVFSTDYIDSRQMCVQFKDETACTSCECPTRPYTLNLNTSLARETFTLHKYTCYFGKNEGFISVDCQG